MEDIDQQTHDFLVGRNNLLLKSAQKLEGAILDCSKIVVANTPSASSELFASTASSIIEALQSLKDALELHKKHHEYLSNNVETKE